MMFELHRNRKGDVEAHVESTKCSAVTPESRV